MLEHKIKVRYENHDVVHNGKTYTRVHALCDKVWIPISLLPQNPVEDEIYLLDYDVLEFYRRYNIR